MRRRTTNNGQRTKPEQTSVPLALVRPSAFNPRSHFDQGELEGLAASIREHGVLQPILLRFVAGRKYQHALTPKGAGDGGRVYAVWPVDEERGGSSTREVNGLGSARDLAESLGMDHYELIAGERRVRAARMAGLSEIPARVVEMDDDQVADVRLVENDQRADITAGERSAAYRQRIDAGLTVDELARRLGKSAGYVRGYLLLDRAPAKLREALDAGIVPPSTAAAVCRVPNERQRQRIAECVLAGVGAYTIHEAEFEDPQYKVERSRWESDDERVLSFRETKELIAEFCTVELKKATFPLDVLDLPGGSCKACPKRAGNDPDLVADGVRADVCTDPGCFRARERIWADRLVDQAGEKGQKVLSARESAKLFQCGSLRPGSAWLDLNESIHLGGGKFKAAEKLIGKALAADVVVAVDAEGRPHRLVDRRAAAAVLEREHKIQIPGPVEPARRGLTEEEKKEKARREFEAKVAAEVEKAAIRAAFARAPALFAALPGESSSTAPMYRILRVLCREVLAHLFGDGVERVHDLLGITGLDAKGRDGVAVRKALGRMVAPDLMGLVSAALVARLCGDRWCSIEGANKELDESLGINRKALESAVRKRFKTEQKAVAFIEGGWRSTPLGEVISSGLTIDHLQRLGIADLGTLADRLDAGDDLGLKSGVMEQLRALVEDAEAA